MRHFHRLSQASLTTTLLLGTTLAFAQPQADEGEKKEEDQAADEKKDESEDEDKDKEATSDADKSEDAKPADEKKSDKSEPGKDEQAKSDESSTDEAAAASKNEGEDEKSDESEKAPETKPTVSLSVKAEATAPNKGEEAEELSPIASEDDTEEAAAAALTDLQDDGPSLTPFKVTTSTFSRFEIREGYEELGVSSGRNLEGDAVFFRARLGLQTNPLPVGDGSDVSIKFNPQASGNWGANGWTGEANWGLYEGYVHWRSPRLETKLGRQMVTYGDEIIFGRAVWNEVGRALDGLRFRYKMNEGFLDLFGFQPAEVHPGGTNRFLEGDEYVWGAYSGFGGYLGDDIETDLYVVGKSWIAKDNQETELSEFLVDVEEAHLVTIGGRVKHRVDWFDYRLEGGIQVGTTPFGELQEDLDWEAANALAYNFDGEFGFHLGTGTRIGLGGVYTSGDDPTTADKNEGWDHIYPAVHRWLGRMDVIGIRTNVMAARMNVQRHITEDLRLDLEGHIFARQRAGGRGQQPQISADGLTEQVGSDMAGVEIDTNLRQALGKFSYVSALYGLFIPSTGHYFSDDLASYGEVQAGVEF